MVNLMKNLSCAFSPTKVDLIDIFIFVTVWTPCEHFYTIFYTVVPKEHGSQNRTQRALTLL